MYFSRRPAPERGARALRALHLSLNTPVIAIEDLAVGPARAAISVELGPRGHVSLLLALRSQRSGQLACFAPDEDLAGESGVQIALDGALSFAESMGFLFDDEATQHLGADGPREAARTWNELLGLETREDEDELELDDDPHAELEVDPDPAHEPGDEEPAELLLVEVAVPGAPAAPPASVQPVAALPAPEPPAPIDASLILTKFRRQASQAGAAGRN
jgi:hypothetical protein